MELLPRNTVLWRKVFELVPHLTIVEPVEGCEIERVAAEFAEAAEGILPIQAIATEIALMDTRSGSWQVRTAIPLG